LKEWSDSHARNESFTFPTGDWNKVVIKFDSTDEVAFSHFSLHHNGEDINLNDLENCPTVWFDTFDSSDLISLTTNGKLENPECYMKTMDIRIWGRHI
jgi:hypothetical protein